MALLTKNRKLLEKLAMGLIEREVVEGSELDALLGIKPPKPPKASPPKEGSAQSGPTPSAPAPILGVLPSPNPA